MLTTHTTQCKIKDMLGALDTKGNGIMLYAGKQEFLLTEATDLVLTYFMFVEYALKDIDETYFLGISHCEPKQYNGRKDDQVLRGWFMDCISMASIYGYTKKYVYLMKKDKEGRKKVVVTSKGDRDTFLNKFMCIEDYMYKHIEKPNLRYKVVELERCKEYSYRVSKSDIGRLEDEMQMFEGI